MNEKEIKVLEEFVANDQVLSELDPWLKNVNFFEIAKNARTEIRHSSVLAWLLDSKGSHGLNDFFVREFIKIAISKNNDKGLSLLDWGFVDFYIQSVQQEWNPKSSTAKNRLDILILFENDKKFIAIENKTTSSEHDQQTITYREMLEQKYPLYEGMYIYLTPKEEDSEDNWGKLSYKDILQILKPIDNMILDPNVKLILDNYREIILKYLVEDEELIEKCNKIYNENKSALDLIFAFSPIFNSGKSIANKNNTDLVNACKKIESRYEKELMLINKYKKSILAQFAFEIRKQIEATGDLHCDGKLGFTYIMFTSDLLDKYIEKNKELYGSWNKSYDTYRLWILTEEYDSKKRFKLSLELGGDNISQKTKEAHDKIIKKFKPNDKKVVYTYKQVLSEYIEIPSGKDIVQQTNQIMKKILDTVRKWEADVERLFV